MLTIKTLIIADGVVIGETRTPFDYEMGDKMSMIEYATEIVERMGFEVRYESEGGNREYIEDGGEEYIVITAWTPW